MESKRKQIGLNATYLLVSQVIARLATFTASIFLVRYLGVDKYGQYSTVIAFVGLFSVVADLGLGQVVIREVAKDKQKAGLFLGNFLILEFFIGASIFILLSLLIRLFSYPPLIVVATIIFGFSIFINSLSIPFQSIISAFEKMSLNALANVLNNLVTASLIIWLISTRASLLTIMSVYSVSSLISLILLAYFCIKKVVKPVFKIEVNFWFKLIRMALPFASVSFLSVIYNKVDILMLSKMKNETVVGIYNAAYRFIDIWWLIPIAINNAFFPHLTRQFKEDRNMLKKNIKRLFLFQGFLGLLIAVFITLFADFIIRLFFGDKFLLSINLLKILIWYIPLHFTAGSLANILMSIGKTEKFAIASAIDVILVVLLNWLFIPRFGYYATSLTTVLSGVILLVLCVLFVHREKLI